MGKLKFIDLYAGIGGIRFGFESSGAECVFSSEWDRFAQATYQAFHGDKPYGDITYVDVKNDIPNHNVLTAGFPCQPFSLAGVSKKNSMGRAHGFDDPTQGTEFFKVKEIIKAKKPEAFFLENVKNLKTHDKGKTYRVIESELKKAGYDFKSFIINSSAWLPQNRARIFIVGFRKDLKLKKFIHDLEIPVPKNRRKHLSDILLDENYIQAEYGSKYTLSPGTWEALKRHRKNHESKGNGFGYGLIEPPFNGQITRTMSARYYKDGGEILIAQSNSSIPRRLLPIEALRLQGFPKKCEKYLNGKLEQPVSDMQLYKQFGNSVSVPVIKVFAKIIIEKLKERGVE